MDKKIIEDVYKTLNTLKNPKMLVFGLGYDSKMWYYMTNKNTFFIEHNDDYINLNKDIDCENIIKYEYNDISVEKSINLLKKNKSFYIDELQNYKIPQKLIELGPFDVIIVDGPTGYNEKCPGRLLPIYWSKTFLSKKESVIYVDDTNRKLESQCIQTFFKDDYIRFSNIRDGCAKIIIK